MKEYLLKYETEIPTVVQEIVRCKDCKNYNYENRICSGFYSVMDKDLRLHVDPDWFCAKGERKFKRGTVMKEPINIEKNLPHVVQETICAKCLHRWIDVRPESTWLKNCECPNCGEIGYVIGTGQILPDDLI